MNQPFDEPGINDNRNYNYEKFPSFERVEYPIITDMVEGNSKVIDLGCGNGSLLEKLIREKNVDAQGVEISKSGVEACLKKGLKVTEGKIDEQLPFADDSFDYAICNVTIQMVMYPEVLLKEMKRIAKYQIVSFPNFAYWKNRIDLLLNGRMPQPMLFGYSWYSTGHIHQFSIKDFENVSKGLKLNVVRVESINKSINPMISFLIKHFSNLFSMENVFLVKKK
jgi:methionine biosynthesis protein MetW